MSISDFVSLASSGGIPYYRPELVAKEIDMKASIGEPRKVLSRNMLVFVAAILLVSPVSASVLCIAPGGHVAIEPLGAECCASSTFGAPKSNFSGNAMAATDGCQNCTDWLISSNECGAIPESCQLFAKALADEGFGNSHLANSLHRLSRQGILDDIALSILNPFSVVPLRC